MQTSWSLQTKLKQYLLINVKSPIRLHINWTALPLLANIYKIEYNKIVVYQQLQLNFFHNKYLNIAEVNINLKALEDIKWIIKMKNSEISTDGEEIFFNVSRDEST